MNIAGYFLEYPASYALIAAFILVFVAGLNDSSLSNQWMLSTRRVTRHREFYRLISVGFVHGSWMHLILNVLGIYFFGTLVEQIAGPFFMLAIFILAVFFGSLYSGFIRRRDADYLAVGASGGVMGLLLSAVMWYNGIQLSLFLLPIAIPGWLFVILFNLGSIAMTQTEDRNRISHEGHLGGALLGGLLGYWFSPQVPYTHSWYAFWLGAFPILLFGLLHGIRPKWFK